MVSYLFFCLSFSLPWIQVIQAAQVVHLFLVSLVHQKLPVVQEYLGILYRDSSMSDTEIVSEEQKLQLLVSIPFDPGGPGSPIPGSPGSPLAPGKPGKPGCPGEPGLPVDRAAREENVIQQQMMVPLSLRWHRSGFYTWCSRQSRLSILSSESWCTFGCSCLTWGSFST